MSNRRQFMQAAAGATALGALAPWQEVLAQAVAEQVKIFYGFPAGSAGDTVARRIGEKFGGTSFSRNAAVVDNRPGASGRIALDVLKTSPADGSHLAVAPVSAVANYPFIYKKLSYTTQDFIPVAVGAIIHHGLAVGPVVPASVKTVKDFVAWAKANPKDANFASPGAGSTPHFIGALLGINAGVELKHVPYRGSVPGVTDVVGGQIAAMVTPHGDFIANAKAGKLRILATSGAKRSPFVPDVPTFAESGFPELTTEEWFGFYAPAKTPMPVVNAINAAVNNALKDKGVLDSLSIVGLIPGGGTQEAAAKWVASEVATWGPLIKRVGFSEDS